MQRIFSPELRAKAMRYALKEGYNDTGIDGLSLVANTHAGERRSFVALFASIIIQGEKRTEVGGRTYIYGEGKCVVNCINRPSETVIVKASPERPFLSFVLRLDPEILSSIISETPQAFTETQPDAGPVFVIDCTDDMCGAFERLLDLADHPKEREVLEPMLRREAHARLLLSELGPWIRTLYATGTRSERIVRAMSVIRERFREPIEADELAETAHMSPATFRRHFRALAGCSPVQYQKTLRLFEARRLITVGAKSVTLAAAETGYASASQFSADFRRFFGETPREVIRREQAASDADAA
ncbi:AraC family transcriptional regulator [Sutterella sp.]|uniref:AraC family transcriptional regulator n=1 Tax=Sutterella sp. TaxID=1981025 RepID=UPI0026DFC4EB|nr:AraC family transcriptional regulator [Sutterella sp.]MDO5531501.1 AraC family transcriptional regulator [Sutterella sp.]